MKILFDQNMPSNLRAYLTTHEVATAAMMGWEELRNGHLLTAAETAGFQVFITGDQSLAYQQNLSSRLIAMTELTKNNWPSVEPQLPAIIAAVNAATPGSYQVIPCTYIYKPRKRKSDRDTL